MKPTAFSPPSRVARRDIVHTLKAETFSQLPPPQPPRIFSYFLVYNEGGARHVAALHGEVELYPLSSSYQNFSSFFFRSLNECYPIYLAIHLVQSELGIRVVDFLDLSMRFVDRTYPWKMARLCIYPPLFFFLLERFSIINYVKSK